MNFFRKSKQRINNCSFSPVQELSNDRFNDTFCCSFENGFSVFDGLTGNQKSSVQTPYISTNFISTINSSNIVLIAPRGENAIHVWDQTKGTFLSIIPIQQRTRITALYMRPDCIIIVSMDSISILNFFDYRVISSVITSSNVYGAFDMPNNYSAEYCAILSQKVGKFTFYSYVQPDKHFKEIRAFQKEINVLKMSPDGKLIAAASLGNKKIRIFRVPKGREVFNLTLPLREDGAASIEFDRFDSLILVLTPSNTLYIYNMDEIDIYRHYENIPQLSYVAYHSLSSNEFFYAYFLSKIHMIIVISQSGKYQRLKYVKEKKQVVIDEEKELDINFHPK